MPLLYERAITYGSFDLLHIGHLRLLRRIRNDCLNLTVGLSTANFNLEKGKQALQSYTLRRDNLYSTRLVDEIIPEHSWDQKAHDIEHHQISALFMGDDWKGKFDHLATNGVRVVYLSRTPNVSSEQLREIIDGNR